MVRPVDTSEVKNLYLSIFSAKMTTLLSLLNVFSMYFVTPSCMPMIHSFSEKQESLDRTNPFTRSTTTCFWRHHDDFNNIMLRYQMPINYSKKQYLHNKTNLTIADVYVCARLLSISVNGMCKVFDFS